MMIESSSKTKKETRSIEKNENRDGNGNIMDFNVEDRDSFEEGYFSLYECDRAILSN